MSVPARELVVALEHRVELVVAHVSRPALRCPARPAIRLPGRMPSTIEAMACPFQDCGGWFCVGSPSPYGVVHWSPP